MRRNRFLPRGAAMLARSWGSYNSVRLFVRLSVHLSVTRVLCDETKEHAEKFGHHMKG